MKEKERNAKGERVIKNHCIFQKPTKASALCQPRREGYLKPSNLAIIANIRWGKVLKCKEEEKREKEKYLTNNIIFHQEP
jgi:hypothetical protein